ncbi:MAG: transglycosylase domain-containing protein, partial [Bdellovibrionota bacterium]
MRRKRIELQTRKKGLAGMRFLDRLKDHPKARAVLIGIVSVIAVSAVLMTTWLIRLDRDIKTRFEEKRFAPPVEFFSAPEVVQTGSLFPAKYFESLFARKAFTRREYGQSMSSGDYSLWSGSQCRDYFQLLEEGSELIDHCVAFVNRGRVGAPAEATQVIALSPAELVIGVYNRESREVLRQGVIEPELFAQYYGEKPVLREVISFSSGEVPPLCLNAVLAIEDAKFYEHPGISVTGMMRAMFTVATGVVTGRRAQGGSTITQQLVKNYFLSDERTIKRKVLEAVMAFLVERHATKDEILETYINLIYMGQNGPFEVRGFAAASQYYFGKPLRQLELPECSLLAAILNSPGLFDPVRHPERSMKRRNLVLDRMQGLQLIDQASAEKAKAAALPAGSKRSLTEPAPYFVQAVRREVTNLGLDESQGLRIYTTLNLRAQEAAFTETRAGLDRLEKNHKNIAKIKTSGKHLEAVFIGVDPRTGFVQALVGGRGFKATQFNRAIDSRRQVGSVMKPFVYLAALEGMTPDGNPYHALSPLKDEATTHKFENQTWTPKNYDGSYNGSVPFYWALKESLNAATVNLGMDVGIDNIVDISQRAGVTSKLKPLPSITLGAFEMTPLEAVQTYSTLANLGAKIPLTFISEIDSLAGDELFKSAVVAEQVAAPEAVAQLIGAMKQTMISG